MNSRRVIIKNVFGSLKNKWRIMKNLNDCVNRALPITITCVLHNYCEMRKFKKPGHLNDAIKKDNLARFIIDRLPILRDGD
jgi:hypothetical protein